MASTIRVLVTALTMGITVGVTQSAAQSLPPLFRNLPALKDDSLISRALTERVKRTYPRDIGGSTLRALLRQDGFSIDDTDAGGEASMMETEFPCITRYVLSWGETESGRVENLRAERRQKCV